MDIVAPARRPGRGPNFPSEFKRKVVEAMFQSGASVSLIVREHDVNANLVFRWRQQYQEGLFGQVSQRATLLPAQVIATPIDLPQVIQSPPKCHSVIVVEAGKAKLRITGKPDPKTLQLIVQQLLR